MIHVPWLNRPARIFIYAVWTAGLAMCVSQGWIPQDMAERIGAAALSVAPLIMAILHVPQDGAPDSPTEPTPVVDEGGEEG